MVTTINTVLGPITPDKLGATLMHEHLKIAWSGWEMDPFAYYDHEKALQIGAFNMKEARDLGVSTVIDPCPMGLGRDPEFMAEVARRSGMQIICSTGVDCDGRSFPPYFTVRTAKEIADLYISDITQGIGKTGIKAGVIKAATGEGRITQNEERALRGAAMASKATGVPIVTHTTAGTMGPEQMDIFLAEGVPANRVMVGHCCHSPDVAYLERVLSKGCYMGFDQIGMLRIVPDEQRFETLLALLAKGYHNKIMLSQDHVGWIVGAAPERTLPMRTLMSEHRHSYLMRVFLPRLRQAGIADAAITTMMKDNPYRLFTGS